MNIKIRILSFMLVCFMAFSVIIPCTQADAKNNDTYSYTFKIKSPKNKKIDVSQWGGEGNDIEIEASEEIEWRVKSVPSWVTLSEEEGEGSVSIGTEFDSCSGNFNYKTYYIKFQWRVIGGNGKWSTTSIRLKRYGKKSTY